MPPHPQCGRRRNQRWVPWGWLAVKGSFPDLPQWRGERSRQAGQAACLAGKAGTGDQGKDGQEKDTPAAVCGAETGIVGGWSRAKGGRRLASCYLPSRESPNYWLHQGHSCSCLRCWGGPKAMARMGEGTPPSLLGPFQEGQQTWYKENETPHKTDNANLPSYCSQSSQGVPSVLDMDEGEFEFLREAEPSPPAKDNELGDGSFSDVDICSPGVDWAPSQLVLSGQQVGGALQASGDPVELAKPNLLLPVLRKL
ncbi:unnamed protein product [Coccothraustes coccothraustes]